jgi:putative transposase
MARGNGRQDIVRDDADRDRLQQELGRASVRCGWTVYAFVMMSNHLHVVLKTPQPNLAQGMQTFLSAYANAWARRRRFCGHVFQGCYRSVSLVPRPGARSQPTGRARGLNYSAGGGTVRKLG